MNGARTSVASHPDTVGTVRGSGRRRWLPGAWTPALLVVVLLLSALSLGSQVAAHTLGPEAPGVPTFVRWFYIDREANIPAWFQGIVLFCCAQALWTIGGRATESRWRRHWRVLAVAFVYLSLDEVTEIHEQTITPLRQLLGAEGFLSFAWILVAVPLLVVFGLFYIRFLRDLPARTRWWFVASAVLYVGGAAGIEMIGAYLWSTSGTETLTYAVTAGLEEAAEMIGMVFFLGALTDYPQRAATDR